jgi:hypothetical protein
MNIEKFAKQFRVRITRDECGDYIIPGKGGGHLYFSDSELCLMVLDGAVANRRRWEALGGKLWTGETSHTAKGRRVQDVKIEGIPIENAAAAIRMVRVRPKRILSTEAREVCLARLRRGRR